MKKFLSILLILTALLMISATVAFAQAPTPVPAPVPSINLLQVLVQVVIVAVVLFVVAFILFQTTELGKGLSRWIADKVPGFSWVAVRKFGSYALALVLALAAVFYPGSNLGDLLGNLITNSGITVDPMLVKVLTSFLITLLASAQQDSGKMPTPLKSSQTAK